MPDVDHVKEGDKHQEIFYHPLMAASFDIQFCRQDNHHIWRAIMFQGFFCQIRKRNLTYVLDFNQLFAVHGAIKSRELKILTIE